MVGKKVIIAGGSGRLGQILSRTLSSSGYEVTVLTRNTANASKVLQEGINISAWDPYSVGDWKKELESSHCVINLSGADIFTKWTPDFKQEIVDSRVKTTGTLVEAMSELENKPEVFINASAAGIYGYDEISSADHNETSQPADDFFGKLGKDWEGAAMKANDLGIRTSVIRTAVVLSMKGGALPELYRMFRRHMGVYIKPGNQWIPWLHILDEVSIFKFVMENSSISGPVNACTETCVTMRTLADTIGKVMRRRVLMGVSESMIRRRMGEVSALVTQGKKLSPTVLKNAGFEFQFPTLEPAIQDLISKDAY